ncbi:MAG: HD domain-containing protein [Amoebophilaceae bacterium]|nr:HD domain-containing protein [Amoebophilaceae bacterium]
MNIDLVIITTFLITTLVIGLYASKGIHTFQDYAVGSRKMSTSVLTVSLIATLYGGVTLHRNLNDYYWKSFYMLILDLFWSIGIYLASRFIIPKMREFIGNFSIAESMGTIYGVHTRMVVAVSSMMCIISSLSAQFKVGLTISHKLFPTIEQFPTFSIVIITIIVIVYSTFGGAKAIALTDIYQFLFFSICLPILIFTYLYRAPNLCENSKRCMELLQYNFTETIIWNDIAAAALTYIIGRIVFYPASIQRFYMSTSILQARRIFSYTAIIAIFISLLFLTIGMVLHIGGHNIIKEQNILYYFLQSNCFPGIQGLLVSAVIALLMSTADSYLHAGSILFAHDLWPFLTKTKKKSSLTVVRIASICIGIASLLMALYTTSIVELIRKTVHIYVPAVVMPIMLTFLGFRPRSATVLCSMGISSMLTGYRIFIQGKSIKHADTLQALMYSLLLLLFIHYLLPNQPNRGWVGVQDYSYVQLQNQETRRWWIRRLQYFKQPFTKLYWGNLFPKNKSRFILFGIYLITSSLVALFYIQKEYFFPYIYWYIAVMTLGTILTIYPACHSYKQSSNGILHGLWPMLLFVLLFISMIQFTKLGHFSPMVCALFIYSLGLGTMLLSFNLSILMLCMALLIHKLIPPSIPFFDLFLANFKSINTLELVLSVALGVAALVGFSTYKWLTDQTDITSKVVDIARTYERRISLEAIYNQVNWFRLDPTHGSKLLEEMAEMLQSPGHYLCTHGQEKLGEQIRFFIKNLETFSKLLLQRAKEERSLTLNKKTVQSVEIAPIILKAHTTVRRLREPIQLLLRNETAVTALTADTNLFERFLTINLLEISKSYQAVDHMITLTIMDTMLRYNYSSDTHVSKTGLVLPGLAFVMSTDTTKQSVSPVYDITDEVTPVYLPKTEDQLYQAESRQIIQAHGGISASVIETETVLTYFYVLPVMGQSVMRFKTYDPTALASDIAETEESLAQEKELVELLTRETTLTKEKVTKTIAFIKNAHGLVTRKSGDPYYTHPMAVTKILLEVTKDPVVLLAALLHDVVEDTPVTLNQIELMYGPEIAYIVDMVTHYNTNGYRWKLADREQKNILDQCKNIRVIQVKLADRLHNIRTIGFRKPEDQKRIAKDTIEFYIPWGTKNKIVKWVAEMKYICQEILNKKEP